jgi:hypothetical protein
MFLRIRSFALAGLFSIFREAEKSESLVNFHLQHEQFQREEAKLSFILSAWKVPQASGVDPEIAASRDTMKRPRFEFRPYRSGKMVRQSASNVVSKGVPRS